MKEIEIFFAAIKTDEILCFTTFTLDETVLVALLQSQKVNPKQRIVVFHDVLRHRNPADSDTLFAPTQQMPLLP